MNKKLRPLAGLASLLAAVSVIGVGLTFRADPACAQARQTTSFAEDILPLLKWRCGSCHAAGGEGTEKSGLDLTTYEGVMKGTKFGPMVIARDPESSNLMRLLDWRVAPAIRMPHGKKKLSTCDRDAVRSWIREGAKNN
jgi:hypothetical protein